MIFPKLKKQLKKTLIKAYIEYEKSFFVLESSLKSHLNSQNAIFSTNLIGSNVSQLTLSFSLKEFSLKLPTVLKVFLNRQKYDCARISHPLNSSAYSSVLIKRSNVLLKNKIQTVDPLDQKLLCVKLKATALLFFIRIKSLNLSLKKSVN
jgi:hypothetical protein